MKAYRAYWLLLALFLPLLAGCPTLVKPQTVEQRLMYAQAQVGAAYKTVADLRKREAISKDDGRAAIEKIDEADKSVKLARTALQAGDISTAEGKLSIALTALIAIESTLKAKQ